MPSAAASKTAFESSCQGMWLVLRSCARWQSQWGLYIWMPSSTITPLCSIFSAILDDSRSTWRFVWRGCQVAVVNVTARCCFVWWAHLLLSWKHQVYRVLRYLWHSQQHLLPLPPWIFRAQFLWRMVGWIFVSMVAFTCVPTENVVYLNEKYYFYSYIYLCAYKKWSSVL